jgi:hypothetical protein
LTVRDRTASRRRCFRRIRQLADDLEFVSLTAGQTILESGDDLTSVYFPTTCIFSLISSLKDGSSVELAMTGDGLIGIPLVLGGDTANYRIVVQHAGGAYRLRAELMSWELSQGGNLGACPCATPRP